MSAAGCGATATQHGKTLSVSAVMEGQYGSTVVKLAGSKVLADVLQLTGMRETSQLGFVEMIVDHPEKVVLHLQYRRLSAVFRIRHAIVHAVYVDRVYW